MLFHQLRYTAHFPETNIFVRQLPSIIKQRDNAIYPAWLAMLPMGVLYAGLVSFVDATIYTMPVYWITGLAAQFGQYVLMCKHGVLGLDMRRACHEDGVFTCVAPCISMHPMP